MELRQAVAFVVASLVLYWTFGFAGVISTDSDSGDGWLVVTTLAVANSVLGLYGALMYRWGRRDS